MCSTEPYKPVNCESLSQMADDIFDMFIVIIIISNHICLPLVC